MRLQSKSSALASEFVDYAEWLANYYRAAEKSKSFEAAELRQNRLKYGVVPSGV